MNIITLVEMISGAVVAGLGAVILFELVYRLSRAAGLLLLRANPTSEELAPQSPDNEKDLGTVTIATKVSQPPSEGLLKALASQSEQIAEQERPGDVISLSPFRAKRRVFEEAPETALQRTLPMLLKGSRFKPAQQ